MTTESQLSQAERDALEDERRIALYPDEPELHDIIRKAKYANPESMTEADIEDARIAMQRELDDEPTVSFEACLREELELFPDEAEHIHELLARIAERNAR